jgi:tyrosine-protein phosphatase SIW14
MSFGRGIRLVGLLLVLSGSASLYAGNEISDYQPQVRYARKIEIHGISNAGTLNTFLYRGSQPDPEAIDELRKLGIDTIVDFRGERHKLMERERKHAQSLGMRFVNIPGSGWSAPTDEQLVRFFSLLREKPRRHIFVHCWLGGDRAGVFLAAYRIAFEGWTPDQALLEMHKFHFHGFWHPVMTAYIKEFPDHLATSRALAPFRRKAAESNTRAAESSIR